MSTSLAESEYDRHEIINGEIYRRSVPVLNHQRIVSNILCTFNNYLDDKNDEVFNNLDTLFDKDNQYMPDIIVVCNPDILEDDGVHGVPDLVVEVLSKTTADRDRNEKFANYERYGVKEYWIVDPFMKRVEVYHLKDDKFVRSVTCQIYTDGEIRLLSDMDKAQIVSEIKVSLYDDFVVNIKDIFERVT